MTKLSGTPTFPNYKILRLIRSLWYIYSPSPHVVCNCFVSSYECSGITGQGQDWFQWSLCHCPGGKDQTEDQDHLWKPQPGVGWEVQLVSDFDSFCFCLLRITLSKIMNKPFMSYFIGKKVSLSVVQGNFWCLWSCTAEMIKDANSAKRAAH